MLVETFLLFATLVTIAKLSSIAVDKVSNLARKAGLTKLGVAALLLALFASLPEISITLPAVLLKHADLAFGTILGSSLTALLFVLGINVSFFGLRVRKRVKDVVGRVFALTASLLLFGLLYGFNDVFGFASLIAFFIISKEVFLHRERKEKEEELKLLDFLLPVSLLFLIFLLGDLVVLLAISLAEKLNLDELAMAATIMAVFSSIPDLMLSFASMKKGKHELMLGNVIGGFTFDMLFLLGIASIISPFVPALPHQVLCGFATFACVLFTAFLQEKELDRYHGVVLLSLFVLYSLFASFL